MGKRDDKLYKLKELFSSGKKISIKDICTHLKIQRQTVYSYLDLLKDEGVNIAEEKIGRKTYLYLDSDLPDQLLYRKITSSDILKFRILTLLQNESLYASELCGKLNLKDSEDSMLDTNSKKTSYRKAINEMIDEGILTSISIHSRYKNRNKINLLKPVDRESSLYININIDEQSAINTKVATGQSQSDALRSLQRKIAILTGDNENFQFDDSLFLQYGRGHQNDNKISEYYNILIQNNFKDYALKIKNAGQKESIVFHTGMVVYSQDKDMLYLMGRKSRTHGISVLKYDNISNITCTNIENTEYHSLEKQKKYEECLQNMFSISTGQADNVEVVFENTFQNRQRLERLCRLRVNGKIKLRNGNLVYTDKISGIDDFANYLRGYGNSYRIIQPESLKKSMERSITRSLERYIK